MLKKNVALCFSKIYEKLRTSGKIQSRVDLANQTGISAQTLNGIAHGTQYVTFEQIHKICTIFPEIQPNDFFGLSGEASKVQDSSELLRVVQEKDSQIGRLIAMLEKKMTC